MDIKTKYETHGQFWSSKECDTIQEGDSVVIHGVTHTCKIEGIYMFLVETENE